MTPHGPAVGPDGIVLAGGRSTRFGGDKLGAVVAGEPLLWRPIRALADAGCATIVVAIGRDGVAPTPPPELASAVRYVRDSDPDGGPLVGLRAGLSVSRSSRAIVAAGDQPALRPALLRTLLATHAALAESGRSGGGEPRAVVLVDPSGVARPLPCVLDREPALAAADRLLAGGERRLRALLRALVAHELSESDWRASDPDATWTIDVDEPADLLRAEPYAGIDGD